ncbi:hypothetical protein [Tautonia plasticadhaerens]|uniref:Uncharacterized protein n=1 Tax=Tautonia plasticadhaerens TaxID=2527974 RepID=A0A518HBS7_9BACT|nr:hypothetical protein [Tautonia plasticadhaerens]QDV38299.1 hypothetical protein ElP_62500 [Tautonia plasticadhaerens]
MKSLALIGPGLLALGIAWGASPAEAQSLTINLADLLAGRGPVVSPGPGSPYGDPYRADRPTYPYGNQGYGQPYGDPYRADRLVSPYGPPQYGPPQYGPYGYNRPALPEEPPYGFGPAAPGYGPPTEYRDSYRPPFPGPGPAGFPGYGPAPGGSAQLASLADTLAGQADSFLQAFAATARDVPEGEQFVADAQDLGAAAGRFRQLAAGRVPPAQLSQELRAVEGAWQRLEQRTRRVARGRTGPNIQQVGLMGNTLQQMRQLLP